MLLLAVSSNLSWMHWMFELFVCRIETIAISSLNLKEFKKSRRKASIKQFYVFKTSLIAQHSKLVGSFRLLRVSAGQKRESESRDFLESEKLSGPTGWFLEYHRVCIRVANNLRNCLFKTCKLFSFNFLTSPNLAFWMKPENFFEFPKEKERVIPGCDNYERHLEIQLMHSAESFDWMALNSHTVEQWPR